MYYCKLGLIADSISGFRVMYCLLLVSFQLCCWTHVMLWIIRVFFTVFISFLHGIYNLHFPYLVCLLLVGLPHQKCVQLVDLARLCIWTALQPRPYDKMPLLLPTSLIVGSLLCRCTWSTVYLHGVWPRSLVWSIEIIAQGFLFEVLIRTGAANTK